MTWSISLEKLELQLLSKNFGAEIHSPKVHNIKVLMSVNQFGVHTTPKTYNASRKYTK